MATAQSIKRNHRRARYLSDGLCAECKQDRDPKSARYCPVHLVKNREAQWRHKARLRAAP